MTIDNETLFGLLEYAIKTALEAGINPDGLKDNINKFIENNRIYKPKPFVEKLEPNFDPYLTKQQRDILLDEGFRFNNGKWRLASNNRICSDPANYADLLIEMKKYKAEGNLCTCPADHPDIITQGCPVHYEKYRQTHCICPGYRRDDCLFHGGNKCTCQVMNGIRTYNTFNNCPEHHYIALSCTCPSRSKGLHLPPCQERG